MQEEIKDFINYCPDNGVFTRKKTTSNRAKQGQICKRRDANGYIVFNINKKTYLGHRVAWFLINGIIPNKMEIDHINRNKSDNRICNLRIVSSSENSRNSPITKRNKSGIVGVSWYQNREKWRATIMDENKQIHLGYFKEKNDAIKARKKAEAKYGYHKNHGIDTEDERVGGFGSSGN